MDKPDQTIGKRYKIEHLIGRGGMGNVYRAIDLQTEDTVAIKHLKSEFVSGAPDIVERFTREGEVLRELNHPNIVTMRESIVENDEHYIVMDFVDGGSLEQYIHSHPVMDFERIMEIALDIADALTRAHRKKVIHRDIKPANVLLASDGTPLLTDFGVAHIANRTRVTEVGSVMGTYAYLSPEACNGESLDERADIWSFGVMLYEMVTGKRPFASRHPAQIITAILSEAPEDIRNLRPDTPPALADLIMGMLQKDRDQRITSVRRVGIEIEGMLSGNSDNADDLEMKDVLATSRFATSTPSQQNDDDGTIRLESTPAGEKPHTQLDSAITAITSNRNPYLWAAIIIFILATTGIVITGLIVTSLSDDNNNGREQAIGGRPQSGPSSPLSPQGFAPPIALNFSDNPFPEDEVLILVAEFEALDTENAPPTRFIIEDLQNNLEQGMFESRIHVRGFPGVIRSDEEALQVAETNNAAIMVWGFYTDTFIQAEIQVGSLANFPYIDFERDEVTSVANLQARFENYDDLFSQSIAFHVMSALGALYAADGNAFESTRLSLLGTQLDAVPASVMGDNIAALSFRSMGALYIAENEIEGYLEALGYLEEALQREPNAQIYITRAILYLQAGDTENALQDIQSAQRLAPDTWALPLFMLAGLSSNIEPRIEMTNRILEIRPDDWYAYYLRGISHYFLRDFEAAKEDFQRAVSYAPPANFPYVFDALIAMRESRFVDMVESLQFVVSAFPDPTYSERLLALTFGDSSQNFSDSVYVSSTTNLILGQYAAVETTTQAAFETLESFDVPLDVVPIAELYMIQGLARCAIGDFQGAEAAYSIGIDYEPDFMMLYLVRNEVRNYRDNEEGAEADRNVILSNDVSPQLVEAGIAGDEGRLTCRNFFEYESQNEGNNNVS